MIPTEVTVQTRRGRARNAYAKPRKRRLNEYNQAELVTLVVWIESDTKLRTEAQLVKEVLAELDFKQHRESFNQPILTAIRRARAG